MIDWKDLLGHMFKGHSMLAHGNEFLKLCAKLCFSCSVSIGAIVGGALFPHYHWQWVVAIVLSGIYGFKQVFDLFVQILPSCDCLLELRPGAHIAAWLLFVIVSIFMSCFPDLIANVNAKDHRVCMLASLLAGAGFVVGVATLWLAFKPSES